MIARTWMERENCPDAWTGFTSFILLNERPPDGYTWSLEVALWSIRFQELDCLEERPAVSGRRVKTQRGELQCEVEDDTAEGLVVKIMNVLLVIILDQCDGRLTA